MSQNGKTSKMSTQKQHALWRTPTATEAGARVETLYTKDGAPAKQGERAYRKTPKGKMVLQSVTLGQQVKMKLKDVPLVYPKELSLFPEDSLASLSVLPGSEKARRMTAISGRKCFELYPKRDPLGSLLKMFLDSLDLSSSIYFLRWEARPILRRRRETLVGVKEEGSPSLSWKISNRLDMPSSHLYFQLTLSEPRTGATGFGLWRTPDTGAGGTSGLLKKGTRHRKNGQPITVRLVDQVNNPNLWPTPTTAAEAPNMGSNKINGPTSLMQVAREMWPTPQAHDGMKGNPKRVGRFGTKHGGRNLNDEVLILPTPKHRDYKGVSQRGVYAPKDCLSNYVKVFPTPHASCGNGKGRRNPEKSPNLQTAIGGQLNPAWVEWLMGCPIGWTDLKVSATAKSFRQLNGSQKK
jgi:hypothetical protein